MKSLHLASCYLKQTYKQVRQFWGSSMKHQVWTVSILWACHWPITLVSILLFTICELAFSKPPSQWETSTTWQPEHMYTQISSIAPS